jgi:hypothetical protein
VPPRFAVRKLEEVPRIPSEPGDPAWYPLQHYFGLTAFGINVYVADADGDELLAEHDEAGSNQEELYVVTAGDAAFLIEGERFDTPALTIVAVPDPTVRRSATAKRAGTTIVAVGGERRDAFETFWQKHHFAHVPSL